MNNRGQFSIIAALLVAVVLVATAITTYSAIRYSSVQDQPQVSSAIDETNMALKQILGFTIGYYGSILRVTGNTAYAQTLARNYLRSGLGNIGDINPEYGASFNLTNLLLDTKWFTNASYSKGTIAVKYDLAGLGLYGLNYSTLSKLDVQVMNYPSSTQALLRVLTDNEPLVGLEKQNFHFYCYNYESSNWELVNPTGSLTSYTNGTYLIDLPSLVDADSFMLQVEDSRGLTVTASSFNHYACSLAWNEDYYSTISNENSVIELLQNGTMRWLGQNLQLTTTTKPIPPIPVKAMHVNQTTIDGGNKEVQFQVEDWASEYRIPLGMASSTTVFSNRQMIVFLVAPDVTKFTIWWDGSDVAVQTPLAVTNTHFFDHPESGTLNNGIQSLSFSSTGFTLNSTVGSTTSVAKLMRINTENDTTNPELAYIIYNGVVRDIVQGEAEWGTALGGGGPQNSPNVYSNIVITLPANATYYTYQLRLMFINSQQQRTISDLCPIQVSTSLGSTQAQTENGTSNGYPIVTNGSGTFNNYSAGWTPHHWSQIVTGTRGAGLMFTDSANQRLYAFDSTAPFTATGALKATTGGNGLIQLLPVTLRQVQFTNSMDITWNGAVVTFNNNTPIYTTQGGTPTGLWILAEYPPTVTVTAET